MRLYFGVVVLVASLSATNCQLLFRLEKALDFGIAKGVKDLNFLLGVAIAKGQLKVMEKHERNLKLLTNVQTVLNKSDVLLNFVVGGKDPLALAVTDDDLWTLDTVPRTLPPPPPLTAPHSLASPLSRSLSDHCLRSVLSECSLDTGCLSAELSDQATGYALTHQLLYWLLYNQKCCRSQKAKPLMKSVEDKICDKIYLEHQEILAQGLPANLQDLYLEQVVLCGVLGYEPFISLYNQNLLTSLQTEKGCFALQGLGDCELHLSGVGIAALALFTKYEHLLHSK